MKKSLYILITVIISSLTQSCEAFVHSKHDIPQQENNKLARNTELNSAIATYIDKHHSAVIRIENYNPDRVDKIFCVHHTVYVETAVSTPESIQAYLKLICAEPEDSSEEGMLLSNFRSLNSKAYLQKHPKQEKYKIITQETPRDAPFYTEDLHRIISNNSVLDRLQNSNFDKKADHKKITIKAVAYFKQNKSCQ